MSELTVFIRVKIDNLKEFSKFIPDIDNKKDKKVNEIIKIRMDKKYLLTSVTSNLEFENFNFVILTSFGLAWDNNSFLAKINNEYNFTNLNPELVEKKEPPIIVKINKINEIFWYEPFVENPILEILLVKQSRRVLKSLLYLSK